MEHPLRCNSNSCRLPLDDRAVVTTCSHIFCLPCSDSLQLSAPPTGHVRSCPACNARLPNPDDAVVAQLNPTEEYKTSVLSGLAPSVILECAGRALGFYGYQCVQEILYQEHDVRKKTEENRVLRGQMERLHDDASREIQALRSKMGAMHLEQRKLEDKNLKLADALRDKSKKHQHYFNQYQRLKQQQHSGTFANVDAESVMQNVTAGVHDTSAYRTAAPQVLPSRTGSNGSGRRHPGQVPMNVWDAYAGAVQRPVQQSTRSAQVNMTPSGHRQRLPQQGSYRETPNAAMNNASLQATPQRLPLVELSLNQNHFDKINSPHISGMSSRVKVGRAANGPYQQAVGGRLNGHSYGR